MDNSKGSTKSVPAKTLPIDKLLKHQTVFQNLKSAKSMSMTKPDSPVSLQAETGQE